MATDLQLSQSTALAEDTNNVTTTVPSISLQQNLEETTRQLFVNSSNTQSATERNSQAAESLLNTIAAANDTASINAATVKQAEEVATLKAQQSIQAVARASGITEDPNTNAVIELITVKNGLAKQNLGLIDEYLKRKNTSFFDDPAAWIKNNVLGGTSDIETMIKDNMYKVSALDQRQKSIAADITEAGQSARILMETKTAASVKAATDLAAASYAVQADQARVEALKWNTAGVVAAENATKTQLNALYSFDSKLTQERQFENLLKNQEFARIERDENQKDRQTQREFQNQQNAERLKLAKDAAEQKAIQTQIEEETLATINEGLVILGYPEVSSAAAKAELKNFNDKKNPRLMKAYDVGLMRKAAGFTLYGDTPYDAFKMVESAGSPELARRIDPKILDLYSRAQTLAATKNKLVDPKDTDSLRKNFNEAVTQLIKLDFQQINPKSGNMFDVGDLKSFLKGPDNPGIEDLNNLPFAQKVLIPAIDANQALDDPRLVLDLGFKAVTAKAITSAEFTDGITTIYRKANLINQQAKNIMGFAINVPEAGRGYKVKVSAFGEVLDLTDPVQVNRYFSQKNAAEFGSFGTKGGPVRRSGPQSIPR